MFYTDYHVHSSFSVDCSTSMEEQIKSAIKKGIQELCFTDHIELGFPEWNYKETDLNAYFAKIQEYQKKYPQIKIKTGAEAGITCPEHDLQRTISLLRTYPFDFVIASSHRMNNVTMFHPTHYEKRNFPLLCREYVKSLLLSLKRVDTSLYNSIGHIDLPIKSAMRLFPDFPWREFKYEYAPDEIDELLTFMVSHGKCPEINTSSWLLPQDRIPECRWLMRYVQTGGEFVTIGSDAHITSNIGKHYKEAIALALESGIRYLAVFKNMQPEYIPLSQCL